MPSSAQPRAPDGLPAVERRGEGLVVVVGACRLGWTLGPGIAKAAVDLALGRASTTPLTAERLGVRPSS